MTPGPAPLPRIIPALLLSHGGLVKTTNFANPVYLGDPINIIRIFNEKEVDELVLLDIDATPEGRPPNFRFLADLCSEAFVPLAYGGGITDVEQMRELFRLGVEKVVVNSALLRDPSLIGRARDEFGSQSIVVSVDAKRGWLGRYEAKSHGGRNGTGFTPAVAAQRAQEAGAGEILLNSIDRDGTRAGYDINLIRSVTQVVDIPVVACGGAGSVADFRRAIQDGRASAVAAGSMFVFQGAYRAVLISFPLRADVVAGFARSNQERPL